MPISARRRRDEAAWLSVPNTAGIIVPAKACFRRDDREILPDGQITLIAATARLRQNNPTGKIPLNPSGKSLL
jgi:hypothetical protein